MAWLGSVMSADLFLSAVTIGEIQVGVERTRGNDPGKARDLEHWLERVIEGYSVLDMDARAFREAARLMHGRSQSLMPDAMIAATAIVNRLIVVTRDTQDFASLGVATLNPFVSN